MPFKIKEEDLVIKTKFSSYFNKEYNDNFFYFHDEAGAFYFSDPDRKIKVPDDELSAAH